MRQGAFAKVLADVNKYGDWRAIGDEIPQDAIRALEDAEDVVDELEAQIAALIDVVTLARKHLGAIEGPRVGSLQAAYEILRKAAEETK